MKILSRERCPLIGEIYTRGRSGLKRVGKDVGLEWGKDKGNVGVCAERGRPAGGGRPCLKCLRQKYITQLSILLQISRLLAKFQ